MLEFINSIIAPITVPWILKAMHVESLPYLSFKSPLIMTISMYYMIHQSNTYTYPSLEGAMKEAGLTDIRASIQRRQNTVAQYISTRPLLDLCKGVRPREGARVTLRWWGQSGINWEKSKAKGTETETTSGSESGTETEGEEEWEQESRASVSSGLEWSGASADE